MGKTHLAAGICRSLIALDRSARFYSATTLVQELQRAKADYALAKALSRLNRYALLVIDDIGYVRKDEAETSVLFELVMHRYERKSLLVTSNQPFSEWENVFSTSAMTVAAVDRLVGGRNTLSGLFSPVPMAGCAANGWFGGRVDGWARLAGFQ